MLLQPIDLVSASKILALALFFPFFIGISIWALFRLSPATVERMRQLPFLED